MNKITFEELCQKEIGTIFHLIEKKKHIKNNLISGDYVILLKYNDSDDILPIKFNSTQRETKMSKNDTYFFDIYV